MLSLNSCLQDAGPKSPDVSGIEVDLEINRFEQALFNLDTNQIDQELAELKEAFPEFTTIFFGQILGTTNAPISESDYIKGFINFPELRKLYDTCTVIYPNLDFLEKEMEEALRYFKYYFPDESTPTLTTFISEYSLGAFIYDENKLALGLDFFLGANYPYARYVPGNPNFSDYLIRSFNKDHMTKKALKPLVEDIVGTAKGGRMIDFMINAGKQLYMHESLQPKAPDSVLLEMTGAQCLWLLDNEIQVWAYLLQENLIYDAEWLKIRKFVEYAPNIPQMHPEAPGRSANWVGFQIVKAFMKNNPEVTLAELVAIEDNQSILDRSKYKPRRPRN